MPLFKRSLFLLLLTLLAACGRQPEAPPAVATPSAETVETPTAPQPPMAEQRPYTISSPQGDREDPWYWLRDDDRNDPDLLAYLRAENDYLKQVMAHTDDLQESLFQEMLARIQQDDSSVPYRKGDYWYYVRYETGREYPIYARRLGSMEGEEQILIDGNQRAEGLAFYQIGGMDVSPSGRMLVWLEDTVGRRQNTLRVRDLETGEVLPVAIERVSSAVFAADDKTLFYVLNHPETLLSYQVLRHQLGAEGDDQLIYEETDPSFYMGIGRSDSDAYISIYVSSTVSSEQRVLAADQPLGEFQVFLPRQRDHEYDAEHIGDRWVVRSNFEAPDFRLFTVPVDRIGSQEAWTDLVAPQSGVFLHGFALFEDFLALNERRDGLRRIRVLRWDGSTALDVASDQAAYTMYLGINPDQSSRRLRYSYNSPNTPDSVFEVDLDSGERTLLKRDPVLGEFDPENYEVEFIHAPARDGERIPISIVYRKGTPRDGSAPIYQTGYGSYGASRDPTFSSARLSLLDRGFVVATAHIRGGQELGRRWYDEGRMLNKVNSFTDFIDVTRHLLAERYGHAERVYAMGGSAGGLLMGAVINMAPELYHGVVAHVPFVDVVTTMLDESIPLTTNEFDEWGNPKHQPYYDYMLAYSPYDQVRAQNYPHLLVTSGLWDSQVQYWEPTKWVAKLRSLKTDQNRLLLHTNLEAGHGGASGRFRRLRETALEFAFIIDLANRD